MANEDLVQQLDAIATYFEKTVSCFKEKDAGFTPKSGTFTVAQQIAHAAQAVEWFMEGAFVPTGFRLEFEAMEEEVRAITSLEDAMAWWRSAIQEAREGLSASAPEAWAEPIRGELMAGMPRRSILNGINDHTAHHRGALAVYARLAGREPPMPYAG